MARKVVTVVFADVTESTRLGESLDPESLRALMTRYFDEMKAVLERHGGVVEKFIGDAVMAVFGVPRVHEDDALRAARAAVEMRAALHRLNEEFEDVWGVTVAARIGINTGEVLAGDHGRRHSFVSGDAVNTAARLQQSAQPGEILIGEPTYRLVQEAIVAADAGPLVLKGKPRPVGAWKLLEVSADAEGWSRRLDSALVGRERELALLDEIFHRTEEAREAGVVTVMGPAGVGKSRLTSEFVSRVAREGSVITGRCLPYGEGITFWPIASAIRDAAGISERDAPDSSRQKISDLLRGHSEAALVTERLEPLLGIGPTRPAIQETFWAVRKLFEHVGAERPLVVVFDDIQWGEPTFLDLLEYIADWIKTAPVLFLCLARPELLELRPAWMMGKPNATSVTLESLTGAELDGLIQNLLGGAELAQAARSKIAEVAEGNPLFVEETLRMLVDDGVLRPLDGRWSLTADLSDITIPPTIHALLAARLDRLEPEERSVIERASVVGRLFWWGAVAELSPPELRPSVIVRLQSLARKELIRPDYSEPSEEASFRFAHILMRDAAYNAIPKAERAELHERLADWIEIEARDLAGEYEEILGYHVEQATRLLLELGPANERTAALGKRAASMLAAGGQRAFARGDMPAAVNLLARAVSLVAERGRERAELLPQLAFALFETGEYSRLRDVVAEATETASASGDADLEAYALILGLFVRLAWEPEGWAEAAQPEARKAIAAFEAIGDERGLGKAWALLGLVYIEKAQFAEAEQAWEKAAGHSKSAGDRREQLESLSWVPLAVWAGPTPVSDGLRRCEELLDRAKGDKKVLGSALAAQAAFEADLGHFDAARELIRDAKAVLQEIALSVWLAGPVAQLSGWIELLAGDAAAADRELRWGYDTLTRLGELSWLSTLAAILAEAVYEQGRHEEAEQLILACEASAGAEDAYSHALLRSVRAKVLAQRGHADEAERLAGEAVALADTTDFLHLRWHTRLSFGEVLQRAGRGAALRQVADAAVAIAKQKGSRVGVERAAELLRLAGQRSAVR
jgi:class 3 adenylate cyclase/tetratricopeptide (TPR) repeat protein